MVKVLEERKDIGLTQYNVLRKLRSAVNIIEKVKFENLFGEGFLNFKKDKELMHKINMDLLNSQTKIKELIERIETD
ncbi:MAG: hypothetical protein ACFFG0_20790 [Candidatus Thorarchaeota archaeon]